MIAHNSEHYQGRTMPFDVWDTWPLDDYRKQAIKYIARAQVKGHAADDLRKARDYLLLLIERQVPWETIRYEAGALLPERVRFWALVAEWRLTNRLAGALSALLFARNRLDIKTAAFHCDCAADEAEENDR